MRLLLKYSKLLSLFSILGILLLLVIPPSIHAESSAVTFTPVADAFVYSSYPDTNYGSSTTLRVDGSPIMRSYVRFDISLISNDSITSAILKVYTNSSISEGFSIDRLSNNTWQENTINFNNAPASGSSISHSGPVSTNQWVSIDITSYVKGAGIYSIVFNPLSATQLNLYSRESGSYAPQLIITQSVLVTSTLTPTPILNTPTLTPSNTPVPTQKTSTPTPTKTPTVIAPTTFKPVADAYVDKSKSTTNYGSSHSLLVDQSPVIRSYIRFDLSSSTYNPIVKATLRIYANSSLDAGFDIDQLFNNAWQEKTIDYENAPTPGATIAKSGPISANHWVSIDLSSYIQSPGIYSLVLVSSSTTQLNLAARESGSYAPQLIISGSSSSSPTSTKTPAPTRTPTPTGTSSSGKVPNFSHIILMIFENREYSSVVDSSSWPHFNSLVSIYTLLTQFYAETHPSLPNYLALTSGSTQGITSDCTTCYINATNIADILEQNGKSWKGYMEDMPSPCYIGNSGDYVQKHNPFIYYNDIRTNIIRCTSHVVPLTQFDTDLSNNHLPDFSWITPSLCDDGHDCSSSTADNFLDSEVRKILASPYFDQNSLLIITFDEGSTNASCCGLPSSAGGHIATLLISNLAKTDFKDSTYYDHYSILKMIADGWSLPYLAHVGDNDTNSIISAWK